MSVRAGTLATGWGSKLHERKGDTNGTLCGLLIDTNGKPRDYSLSDAVTCKRCLRAASEKSR